MTLNELKKQIDELALKGYGETELRVSEANNELSLWSVLDIGLEDILAINDKNNLCNKEVLVLYSGSDED